MSARARWAAARVLRLYPTAWRDRYGEELEALLECHDVTRRTLLDLLLGALDAWRNPAYRPERRLTLTTRIETLAGLGPFLCFGAAVVLFDLVRLGPFPETSQFPYLLVYLFVCFFVFTVLLMPMLGLGIGWAKAFPRWSYPYVGFALVLSLYFESQPTPSLTIFGLTFLGSTSGHTDLLGWRAWLPLAVAVVAAVLVTRSPRPLGQLFSDIWHDWTRLSFALYGLLPLLLWLFFDEVRPSFRLPYMVAMYVVLAVGALAYLLSREAWRRALALALGTAIALGVETYGGSLYWLQHHEPWMESYPQIGWDQPRDWLIALVAIGTYVAVILSPGLLGLARRALQAKDLRAASR